MEKQLTKEIPVNVTEADFERLVEFVKRVPREHPELAAEFEKRKLFWEGMIKYIDGRVAAKELTFEETRSLKAGVIAGKEIEGTRDFLTGLLNRGEWERRFSEAHANSVRHNQPLAAVLADVNRLRQINNEGGHGAGDRALKKVASVITASIRQEDIAGRVGGDEFRIGCVSCGLEEAQRIALRIKALLSGVVTVSIGVGEIDFKSESIEVFIERVDETLYQAKGGSEKLPRQSHVAMSYFETKNRGEND